MLHLGERLGRREGRPVRPVGGHRVVGVAAADDARHEWDVLTGEPVRISLAVLPVGANTGGSSWAPSLPAIALLNVLGLLNDGRVTVSFRFQPVGLGAKWQIDDLYVDPLKMG